MLNTPEFQPVLPPEFLKTRPLVDVFLDPVRQMQDLRIWTKEVMEKSNTVRKELLEILDVDGWDNIVRNVRLSLLDRGVFFRDVGQVPRSQTQISELLLTVGYQINDERLRKDFLHMHPLQDRIMGQLWGMGQLPRSAYEKTLPNTSGRAVIMNSIYEAMSLPRSSDIKTNRTVNLAVPEAFLRAFDQ